MINFMILHFQAVKLSELFLPYCGSLSYPQFLPYVYKVKSINKSINEIVN